MVYMSETITARNTVTRKVGQYKRRLVEHPVLGKFLEEVESGAKDYVALDTLVREKFDLPAREEVFEYDQSDEEEVD